MSIIQCQYEFYINHIYQKKIKDILIAPISTLNENKIYLENYSFLPVKLPITIVRKHKTDIFLYILNL